MLDGALSQGITFLEPPTATARPAARSSSVRSSRRRDEVVLATKFGMDLGDGWTGPRGAPDYIRLAVENSLRRLQTDVIDLYWYHRPDGVTPIGRHARQALDELVRAGKVRAIGASNFSAGPDRGGRRDRTRARADPVHRDPERVQPAAPRARVGRAAALRAARHRLHPVLPTGLRAADRQVPARPGGAGGRAPLRRASRSRPTRSGASWRRWPATRRSAECRSPTSQSGRC